MADPSDLGHGKMECSAIHLLSLIFQDNLDIITIQPHHEAFEGIGHFSDTLTGIDATKIALAYNCSLKPETLAEFVIDNAWQLQMVQQEHTRQIRELKLGIAKGKPGGPSMSQLSS